jgi:hypothetical protein
MSEHHRDAAFENDFHKTKPGQSVWFRTYAHESLLFYENLFYIRNQEDKRIKRVPKTSISY